MSILRRALATSNLCNMGFDPDAAVIIGKEWHIFQESMSVDQIEGTLRNSNVVEHGFHEDVGGRVYMSCHFGAYAAVIRSLAIRTPANSLHCLIGEQTDKHRQMLCEIAKKFGVTLNFIESGFSMIRNLRGVLRDGLPVFVLIDVPWGTSGTMDAEFAFVGGTIRAKTGLFRMIERLGYEQRFVLCRREGTSLDVTDHGTLDQNGCFEALHLAVATDPAAYERLYTN